MSFGTLTHIADAASLARAIRSERRRHGLKQDELAAMAGVALGSLKHVEQAGAPVTTETLLRITDALALDIHLVPRSRSQPVLLDE